MTEPAAGTRGRARGRGASPARIVEVFADVGCPFTHVGLRRWVQRRQSLGRSDVRLVVRAWPLELVNGAPLDAAMIAEEVEALRRDVAPDLFAGFDPASYPASSLPALRLAAAAYREGVLVGERVSLALRDALFERGEDIADPAVLHAVAAAGGMRDTTAVDDEDVMADWHSGQRRGVVGSPHFFVPGGDWFCPSLSITRVGEELRITVDEATFDRFATASLVP